MRRLLLLALAVLTGDPDPRAADPVACVDLQAGTCRIDQVNPCLPTELDSCACRYRPCACTAPGASCVVSWPGDECPTGWYDACDYFGP